jgi:hypothetical protein
MHGPHVIRLRSWSVTSRRPSRTSEATLGRLPRIDQNVSPRITPPYKDLGSRRHPTLPAVTEWIASMILVLAVS